MTLVLDLYRVMFLISSITRALMVFKSFYTPLKFIFYITVCDTFSNYNKSIIFYEVSIHYKFFNIKVT